MAYIFQITPYDIDVLLPQVSRALETRTQDISRKSYSGMWKVTDWLSASVRPSKSGRIFTRILAIVCLALGIFLFVPGLMKPEELRGPLTMGIVAIGSGIGGLWRSRKKKKNPFDESAELLLAGKGTIADLSQVIFADDGMLIREIKREEVEEERISYSSFEYVIEGDDIYLITFTGRVMLLQKHDLTEGSSGEFDKFISRYITIIRSM